MDDLSRQRLNRESRDFRSRLAGRMGMEPAFASLYYDRAGEPIELGDWAYLHADQGYVRVASTTLGEAWISTVWLGHDMSFGMGPPVLFETMIFGGPLSDWQDRYHDEAEALRGHIVAVALVQSIPFWRRLTWIVAESYRQARDAWPGGGWPRYFDAEPEPLWKVGT